MLCGFAINTVWSARPLAAGLTDRSLPNTWWGQQMKTFSALLDLCAGNSPVTDEFPSQRPVTRTFDVFFDLHLSKRLSKQSKRWWFKRRSRLLWRHCNDFQIMVIFNFCFLSSAERFRCKQCYNVLLSSPRVACKICYIQLIYISLHFGGILIGFPWWRHQMETFSALLALLCGEFTGYRTKASDAELWFFLWSAPE